MIKTVKELKELLEQFPDDCEVIVGYSDGLEYGWSSGRGGDGYDKKEEAKVLHFYEPGDHEQ